MIKQTAITVIGAAALATSAQAEVEYDVSVGAHSQYVWRGVDQGGGQLIDAAVTASTEVNGFDLSANVWYATTGGASDAIDEVDVTLAWEKELSFATLSGGAIYYGFPDATGDTVELFLGASRDLFAGVSGSIVYYKDVDANDGNDGYAEIGLAKDFEFGTFAPSLGVTVGYDVEDSKFTHYQFDVSTSYSITDTASLDPYLAYSKADSNPKDEFFGGVALTVTF